MNFGLPPPVRDLGLEDVYSQHLDEMPRAAPPGIEESVKRDLLDLLKSSELVNLSTVSPSGWTATHCMHFCAVEGPGLRPIIYMSTQQRTRKVGNVKANARASLTCYRAFGFEERRKTRSAQMQAVCRVVEDPEECQFAVDQMHAKAGYEFTALLELRKQALLRADVVFSLWQDIERRPQRCTVDFRSQLALES